jgi:cell division topological specificity factor
MGLFDRVVGRNTRSAESAKERLRLILIHDRTDITQDVLEALKDDLLATISRHVEIDSTAVRIDITREGRSQRLLADIPLKNVTRRRTG